MGGWGTYNNRVGGGLSIMGEGGGLSIMGGGGLSMGGMTGTR